MQPTRVYLSRLLNDTLCDVSQQEIFSQEKSLNDTVPDLLSA